MADGIRFPDSLLPNSVGFVDLAWFEAAAERYFEDDPEAEPLELRGEALVSHLEALGHKSHRLLRVYIYDAPPLHGHPRERQRREHLDRVRSEQRIQLREGYLQKQPESGERRRLKRALSEFGVDFERFKRETGFDFEPVYQQKGVDTRLCIDLVEYAHAQMFDAAMLIGGDQDLAPAVAVAQDLGRRVYLYVPPGAVVAEELRKLADGYAEFNHGNMMTLFPGAFGRRARRDDWRPSFKKRSDTEEE